MSAGQFVDRVINAALIKSAEAANWLMAMSVPMKDEYLVDADRLADAEAAYEVLESPHTCDISGCPPAVEDVAPPTGAGPWALAAGAGGHPDRATSELLEDAADRIEKVATRVWGGEAPIAGFIAELRDRAAAFAAFGD